MVGAGYSGLWTALIAKERDPSLDVVVLEAGTAGWAASGRNGGFCSASLTHGLWSLFSRNLTLTIGLPLAGGLSMRQLGGVLAHEFGHFAQGAGMKTTYVVRVVSFWFARVVYERDRFDAALENWAKGLDLRIGIVLHAARLMVWVSRPNSSPGLACRERCSVWYFSHV